MVDEPAVAVGVVTEDPKLPDGTRGFTIGYGCGRGKALPSNHFHILQCLRTAATLKRESSALVDPPDHPSSSSSVVGGDPGNSQGSTHERLNPKRAPSRGAEVDVAETESNSPIVQGLQREVKRLREHLARTDGELARQRSLREVERQQSLDMREKLKNGWATERDEFLRIKDLLKRKNAGHHSENSRMALVLKETETAYWELREACLRMGMSIPEPKTFSATTSNTEKGLHTTTGMDAEVEELERQQSGLFERDVLGGGAMEAPMEYFRAGTPPLPRPLDAPYMNGYHSNGGAVGGTTNEPHYNGVPMQYRGGPIHHGYAHQQHQQQHHQQQQQQMLRPPLSMQSASAIEAALFAQNPAKPPPHAAVVMDAATLEHGMLTMLAHSSVPPPPPPSAGPHLTQGEMRSASSIEEQMVAQAGIYDPPPPPPPPPPQPTVTPPPPPPEDFDDDEVIVFRPK